MRFKDSNTGEVRTVIIPDDDTLQRGRFGISLDKPVPRTHRSSSTRWTR